MPVTACDHCGAALGAGSQFCAECGTEQGGGTAGDRRQVEALRIATAGQYDIRGELGRGGMATVYLAHDLALDRSPAESSLRQRLEDAIIEFEASHPELARRLGRVIDTLAFYNL